MDMDPEQVAIPQYLTGIRKIKTWVSRASLCFTRSGATTMLEKDDWY